LPLLGGFSCPVCLQHLRQGCYFKEHMLSASSL
jgi:hypothetical protein